MLVHTAIPNKHKDSDDYEPNFTISGTPSSRKRKMRDFTSNDAYTLVSELKQSPKTPILLNKKRSSNRQSSSTDQEKVENEAIELNHIDLQNESADNSLLEDVSEVKPKPKYQYIVVKPKPNPVRVQEAPIVLNNRGKKLKVESAEEVVEEISQELYFSEDQGDISSTQFEIVEEQPIEVETENNKSISMEGYSEFIFNGEKYVQMPKRIFEAEKEKLQKETEKYKQLLRKLKGHLNKLDLN